MRRVKNLEEVSLEKRASRRDARNAKEDEEAPDKTTLANGASILRSRWLGRATENEIQRT